MAIKYIDTSYNRRPGGDKTPKQLTATITAISKANGAVITAANDFSNGDLVFITGVAGMTEINNRGGTVASASATGFTVTEIDSTSFTTYTSGGVATKQMTVTNHVRVLIDDTKSMQQTTDSIQVAKEAYNEFSSGKT